ncbi:unnamed protein product [Polarella glacialis]|uniref:Glutathione transferase n=1 Tax=Polarella glacialis TaxID=89957 RepID=A0A813KM69_POLGL|nr:unnamed protein product [Polarella glacialis]
MQPAVIPCAGAASQLGGLQARVLLRSSATSRLFARAASGWSFGPGAPLATCAVVFGASCLRRPAVLGRKALQGRSTRGAASIRRAGPTLIGSQGSRSPLVNWYLHELGQEFRMVEAATVDRRGPDYPHPFGQIPALQDGSVQVFESGAILMYLADKYGGLDTPEKRAEASKWVFWANATLDGICFVEDGNGRVLDTGLRKEPKAINRLEQLLEDREFILGDSFSVADVAIGAYLLYVPQLVCS